MKKYLFIAVLALASVMAYAQPRAIGGNLGSGIGFSYQHSLGESNMLDVALNVPLVHAGANLFGIGGIVTYDWIDPFNAVVPWEYKGEWHWYMGVGGAAGLYNFNPAIWHIGAAGHFGIEYDFWFPLQLSLDYRPNIGICGASVAGTTNVDFNRFGLYDGITLGVRYKF